MSTWQAALFRAFYESYNKENTTVTIADGSEEIYYKSTEAKVVNTSSEIHGEDERKVRQPSSLLEKYKMRKKLEQRRASDTK
jgi:hypothetical protein